jgi:hypothetical protein
VLGALRKVPARSRRQLGLFGAACLVCRAVLLRRAASVAGEPTTETSWRNCLPLRKSL